MNKKTDSSSRKRRVAGLVFGITLTAYSVYILLDAFVIPRDVIDVSSTVYAQTSSGSETAQSDDADNRISDQNASDDNASENIDSESNSSHGKKHKKPDGRHGGKSQDTGSDSAGKEPASDSDIKSTSDANDNSASDANANSTSDSSVNSASDKDENSASGTAATGSAAGSVIGTYSNSNTNITVTEMNVNQTSVYVADVVTDDPSALLSGLADGSFGRNLKEKTSEIAEDAGAILAINGDYYGFRDAGYVMRNGYLYRTASSGSDSEDLVVYSDGTMKIIREGDVTAEELAEQGAVQIYSFGPGLVESGEVSVSDDYEVDQAMRSNPRTAIGMIEAGHYVFVVSDGRTDESEGLTVAELASVMKDLGCTTAYNLDGGGSSTMYFNGEIINNPTTNGNSIKERSVSDIVYIQA